MSDSEPLEETILAQSYFNKQGEKHRNNANAQIRKGHYNGEQYHRLQESTRVLIIVYYITFSVFVIWFIIRGAYSGMSKSLIAVNSFVLITIPYLFYYYFVDWVMFIFNHIAMLVTSISVRNLIAMVMSAIIGIVMLATLVTTPIMHIMIPIIITLSVVVITLGIVLRGTFMA